MCFASSAMVQKIPFVTRIWLFGPQTALSSPARARPENIRHFGGNPRGQNLPQSLYERVCWLALVWIYQSLRKKHKCFFLLQNLSPCSILSWQLRRLWTHYFSFNALKNAGNNPYCNTITVCHKDVLTSTLHHRRQFFERLCSVRQEGLDLSVDSARLGGGNWKVEHHLLFANLFQTCAIERYLYQFVKEGILCSWRILKRKFLSWIKPARLYF